ncbi:hypothetical protein D3C87_1860920 [compost metagenome]
MNKILLKLKKTYTLFATDSLEILALKTAVSKVHISDQSDELLITEQLELMDGLVDKLSHNSLDISLLAKRSL